MWLVRELIRLLERIALAFIIALVIAEVRALALGGDTWHGFKVSCLIMGAVLVLMAAIGRNNNFERRLDYGITEAAWGRIPGVSTLKRNPEDPSLTPGAVLGAAGLALLAVGLFA
jgi:uncharacterized membrane protein